jgi:GntR family transcriptional regulator, transcriptional repressor for pyruvate dehydrogenase complex
MVAFPPVRTRRTFEEALEQIAEAIRAGDLRQGDRLPSERDLAAQMQISRPTLREAIEVLVESGVLQVRTGQSGGMFVASDVVPLQLLRERGELRVNEVAQVLEARRVLEPQVAQLAAVYGTAADFDAMERTIGLQREARGDHLRSLQMDLRFHLQMARATRNETIVALMRTVLRQLEIARDMALHDANGESDLAIAIHERTLAALRRRDAHAIALAMDEHMRFLERVWEAEGGRRLRRAPRRAGPVKPRSRGR